MTAPLLRPPSLPARMRTSRCIGSIAGLDSGALILSLIKYVLALKAGGVRLCPGLTPAQFSQLADVPPEVEWPANITNAKTRRAYKTEV